MSYGVTLSDRGERGERGLRGTWTVRPAGPDSAVVILANVAGVTFPERQEAGEGIEKTCSTRSGSPPGGTGTRWPRISDRSTPR